jgi:tRNA threonylcarbamoyladenosine biosynthesis protein TsaB
MSVSAAEVVLVAFDTATEVVAAAAGTAARHAARTAAGGAAASATLLPTLRELLRESGHAFGDVAAVAFGRGPGAFTGIRTSAAVAQGLAFGLARPVLAIDSLLIVAEDARAAGQGDDILVAMDARMGEVYAARYRFDGQRWHTVLTPMLCAPAVLAAAGSGAVDSSPPACIAGSALVAFGDAVVWPASARRWPTEADRAGALWRLACAAWAAGEAVDAAQALPLYLRDKVALTTAERAAQKAAP